MKVKMDIVLYEKTNARQGRMSSLPRVQGGAERGPRLGRAWLRGDHGWGGHSNWNAAGGPLVGQAQR